MTMAMTVVRLMRFVACLLSAAGLCNAAPVIFDQRPSAALRREAYDAVYNLDYDRADALFGKAIEADPGDPAAYRGAAAAIWQRALFLRGTLLVDEFMGHVRSRKNAPMPAPPEALAAAFHRNVDRAIALAETAVSRHDDDASAHCDLGAAVALAASFGGSIEGRIYVPGSMARRAFSEYERAYKLDPGRKDAGLVLGNYRYALSRLPKVVQWAAGVIGFHGGRAEGIRLIEEAAEYPGDLQTEARFALVLLYTRLDRHADAVALIRTLEQDLPRNRLLLLEEACALLRDRKPAEAEARLDLGLARVREESRPLMPGEEGRWHYTRGMARVLTGRLDLADDDLRAALAASGVREWVQARIHVERGKVADMRDDRAAAQAEYGNALTIATRVRDLPAQTEARRWLAQPFRQ